MRIMADCLLNYFRYLLKTALSLLQSPNCSEAPMRDAIISNTEVKALLKEKTPADVTTYLNISGTTDSALLESQGLYKLCGLVSPVPAAVPVTASSSSSSSSGGALKLKVSSAAVKQPVVASPGPAAKKAKTSHSSSSAVRKSSVVINDDDEDDALEEAYYSSKGESTLLSSCVMTISRIVHSVFNVILLRLLR